MAAGFRYSAIQEANNTTHVQRLPHHPQIPAHLADLLSIPHTYRWRFWPTFCILEASFAISKGISSLLPLVSPSAAPRPGTATPDDVRHVLELLHSAKLSLIEQGREHAITRS